MAGGALTFRRRLGASAQKRRAGSSRPATAAHGHRFGFGAGAVTGAALICGGATGLAVAACRFQQPQPSPPRGHRFGFGRGSVAMPKSGVPVQAAAPAAVRGYRFGFGSVAGAVLIGSGAVGIRSTGAPVQSAPSPSRAGTVWVPAR